MNNEFSSTANGSKETERKWSEFRLILASSTRLRVMMTDHNSLLSMVEVLEVDLDLIQQRLGFCQTHFGIE